jgi:outer membrane protein assembly factor BamB
MSRLRSPNSPAPSDPEKPDRYPCTNWRCSTQQSRVVYVGSFDDKLYAFNASTGAVLWIAMTGSIVQSSPAVANGVVYVGSYDHKLYAYNASGSGSTSCAPLWTATTGSDAVSSALLH